ncbi:MAG TPA: O-antigen ligase family protein [Ignavibacteriaceae bacterium]|nr:O-antigen ligase family protein [Ignavibacteriaceae bacterium]
MSISKNEIIVSTLLSIVVFAFTPYILIATGLAFIIMIFLIIDKKYFPSIIVVSFLIVTSTISPELRSAMNILSIFLLIYLYIEKYELSFKKIHEIPKALIYVCICIYLSMLVSSVMSVAFNESVEWLVMQIEFFIIIYLLYSLLDFEESIYLFSNSIIVAAVFTSLGLLISFIISPTATLLLVSTGMTHEEGFTGNPAGSANLIFIASMQIIFYLMQKPEGKKKAYLITTLVFFSISLLLTNSRAAILGYFIAILFMLFISNKKYFNRVLRYILAISVIAFISSTFLDIFSQYFRVTRIFENTRYIIWDMTLDIIKQNPIFGVGPGVFRHHIYNNLPIMLGSWDENQIRWVYDNAGTGHSHNFFLYKTSELGLVGLTISLFFLGLNFKYGISLLKYFAKEQKQFKYVSMIIAVMIGLLVRGLFESTGILTYGWLTRDLPFWLLIINLIYLYNKYIYSKKIKIEKMTNA